MSEIILQVDGTNYAGWTAVSVSRSIETVAGAFDLACTENVGGAAAQWPLRPNQKCKILVNGQTVIDGYIDKVSIDVSDSAHGIAVSGRDKTGDLVDCAAVHSPAQWRNIKLLDLVKILAAPFGLEVILETVAIRRWRCLSWSQRKPLLPRLNGRVSCVAYCRYRRAVH